MARSRPGLSAKTSNKEVNKPTPGRTRFHLIKQFPDFPPGLGLKPTKNVDLLLR